MSWARQSKVSACSVICICTQNCSEWNRIQPSFPRCFLPLCELTTGKRWAGASETEEREAQRSRGTGPHWFLSCALWGEVGGVHSDSHSRRARVWPSMCRAQSVLDLPQIPSGWSMSDWGTGSNTLTAQLPSSSTASPRD